MIAELRGTILDKRPPHILVDVAGIGYEIDAPMSTFYELPEIGQVVRLYTHFLVREDEHRLFGFYTAEERNLFRTVLKVNGVGPRLGLAILSGMTPSEFVQCILCNDATRLTSLPGVGKKTAERLVIEMRDKLNERAFPAHHERTQASSGRQQILQDAISALVSLGYKQPEANRIVTKIDDGSHNSESLIRLALKEFS